jgi:ATPase family AAA domain-containing protein 3A/B
VASDVNEAALKQIAKDVEGFSGRQISKMMASVQGAVYGSASAEVGLYKWNAVVTHSLKRPISTLETPDYISPRLISTPMK